ncbi:MAG TPA: CHAT domain-containing tetratricopeptide repeat protein [Blastocatellia bacterium]|nr:CHAT domain-containing tetratricopeptide repeat protein [Blastocatellia bacterium]
MNRAIERRIVSEEVQQFLINLEAGQYVRVEVDQETANVNLALQDPDGKLEAIAVRDPRGPLKEILETVIEKSGSHLLSVRSKEEAATGAQPYRIVLAEVRAAATGERERARAEKLQRQSFDLRRDGKFEEALQAAAQALDLRRKYLGPERFDTAESLNQLGNLYAERGEYVEAERMLKSALTIREKTRSNRHPAFISTLSNLGVFYLDVGAYHLAERNLRDALARQEEISGPDSLSLPPLLNNLAEVYRRKPDYPAAESHFRRAIKILENTRHINPKSPDVGRMYSNLGQMFLDKRDYVQAEAALKRAQEIFNQKVGPLHPSRGILLNHLATASFFKGDYEEAEKILQQALKIYEQSLDRGHPRVAEALNNLVAVYRASGRIDQAIEAQQRSVQIGETYLRRNLSFGSESRKLSFLKLFAGETNNVISLHAQYAPEDPRARRLAFTTQLQRKGRILDEMHLTLGLLRREAGPEGEQLIERLRTVQQRRSELVTKEIPADGRLDPLALTAQLDAEYEELLTAISARSALFRAQTQPVTIEAIQHELPRGSALVEFVRYFPVEARTRNRLAPRYLAYVLRTDGDLKHVDLGEAAKIDRAITELRHSLHGDHSGHHRAGARAVYGMVMQPVRKLLGSATMVLVSPEGQLNLLPFAALIDETDHYLIHKYLFVYLTSGRDLLRPESSGPGKQQAQIFAVSSFNETASNPPTDSSSVGATSGPGDDQRNNRTSSGLQTNRTFEALPSAKAEGQAIKSLVPNSVLWVDQQATETAIKELHRPRLLHIVTHGFFLDDEATGGPDGGAQTTFSVGNGWENPLLRSGIALAGANQRRSGRDDGILTAYEVAAIDLWGTELVVLSACVTGRGEIQNGEGVYGLRRALVLAGAEAQLMSLWDIPDRSTADFMAEYYQRLLAGEGRAEAVRRVQLQMLDSREYKLPRFWAAFIPIGRWTRGNFR